MTPFSEHDLSEVLRHLLEKTLQKIKALDSDYVLKASPTELEQHFLEESYINPLVLHVDDKHIADRSGTDIDVSHDFSRAVFPGERAVVRGTRLRIDIPYEGDRDLWRFRPSSYSLSGYPDIDVHDDRISLTLAFPDDSADPKAIKSHIDSDVQRLAAAVTAIKNDVTAFNAGLPEQIKTALDARRRYAQETTDAVAQLGIPMKRAQHPPAYAIPTRRKKAQRSLPTAQTQPYEPEPFFPLEEYEYVLGILKSMGMVIERNPQSFVTLDEEGIRTHFLLQLNGHYEGTATGETFNAVGKTDILIRVKDRNVFIAECKFWKGPKAFDQAITQLLGYLSWRDSKCALLIFNRNKDSSTVAEKMHAGMLSRSECKKHIGKDNRGDQRYVFVKSSDPGREIMITTMLFDVPGGDEDGDA